MVVHYCFDDVTLGREDDGHHRVILADLAPTTVVINCVVLRRFSVFNIDSFAVNTPVAVVSGVGAPKEDGSRDEAAHSSLNWLVPVLLEDNLSDLVDPGVEGDEEGAKHSSNSSEDNGANDCGAHLNFVLVRACVGTKFKTCALPVVGLSAGKNVTHAKRKHSHAASKEGAPDHLELPECVWL